MKVGVRVPCYRAWCGRDEVLAIASLAEAAGFDSLWVQDHLVAPVGSGDDVVVRGLDDWMTPASTPGRKTLQEYYAGDDWWLEPFVTWGFLAAATTRVMLASDIVVVPYRNPLVQAKMIGTLDVLSGGRMIIGTGSGHVAAESSALGVDFDVRGRMHDEYLRVITLMLSAEEVAFDGEFIRFGPLRTMIRPVQQPHPPIYVGGHGKRAIRRAAELGDGWLPSVTDPDALARGIEELRLACARIGRDRLPTIALSLPSLFRFDTGAGRGSGSRPVTTTEAAIALLRRFEEIGVEHVSLGFPMPNVSVYLAQITHFADEVLPAVRTAPDTSAAIDPDGRRTRGSSR